ncbi:hypothetical protein BaRGS_00015732, partial [Batillaria attramentaria]
LCGNAIIEKGEECDAGLQVGGAHEQCCTRDCKLMDNAVCSDVNFACCVDCKVAANGTSCGKLRSNCTKAAYCDGKNLNCPEPEAADDNTPCLDRGECHNGKCLSFCAVLGKKKGENLAPCEQEALLEMTSRTVSSLSLPLDPVGEQPRHCVLAGITLDRAQVLMSSASIQTSNLKATTVDRHGRETTFHVNPHDFYTGHLAEGRSVKVHAHFEDGILSASVHFPSEVYVVEPAWRHLPPSDNYTMIVYRASDVKRDEATPLEGTSSEWKPFPNISRFSSANKTIAGMGERLFRREEMSQWNVRLKRAKSEKKICRLLIVVDYDFYRDVGKTKRNTLAYLAGIIQSVNERYKKTEWEGGMTGFGVQIAHFRIHTEYTAEMGHYNWKSQWQSRDKLMAFFRGAENITKYCLGHLFTSYSFQDKTLGLATKPSSDLGDPQGICGFRVFDSNSNSELGPNGGFSTAKDHDGNTLLKLELEIVCGHEIGHGWGADHDPATTKCAPSSWNGGRYLMWPYASTGMAPNNVLFSPCSKEDIAPVLKAKSSLCFISDSGSNDDVSSNHLCGNAIIDKGEECDAGVPDTGGFDVCCTKDCKLMDNAECSDVNFACCVDCKVAASVTRCEAELSLACRKAAYCDGKSLNCPESEAADDNTPCLDRGECHNGECLSFCAVLGKKKGDRLAPRDKEKRTLSQITRSQVTKVQDNVNGVATLGTGGLAGDDIKNGQLSQPPAGSGWGAAETLRSGRHHSGSSPNLKATTVDRHGRETTFHVNPHDFYTGHLAEGRSVKVHAHFEDGILSAIVHFPSEVYVVEPAWRHLPPSDNYTMIVYRASDVKRDEATPLEGTSSEWKPFPNISRFSSANKTIAGMGERLFRREEMSQWNVRLKRAKSEKKICRLLIVVDYDFYRDVGKTKRNTLAYLAGIIQSVNERYKKTEWEGGMTGFGVQIAHFRIHTEYTAEMGHYNWKSQWQSRDKLMAFFRGAENITKYCLGHLFTSYSFQDKTLGLATKPSSDLGDPQGICGFPVFDSNSNSELGPNGGFSTAKDHDGNTLLKLELEIVCGHEIGHGWGADHDPATTKCAPSSWNGGRYLMWPYASTGMAPNNVLFSPCSKEDIAPVLKAKSNLCFISDSGSNDDVSSNHLCGNAIIDKGEECDAGVPDTGGFDVCCTKDCKLKDNAECSDVNFACCVDCKVAASGTRCEAELSLACRKAAYCDGKSLNCPESEAADDNTPCLDRGECHNGECLSFCAVLGKKKGDNLAPCVCDQNSTASCRYCCLRNVSHSDGTYNTTCEPTEVILSDGRPCDLGFCLKGECQIVEADMILRLINYITSLNINRLKEFMRSNIVLAVTTLSLLIWIPASLIFSRLDKETQRLIAGDTAGDTARDWSILAASVAGAQETETQGRTLVETPPGDRLRYGSPVDTLVSISSTSVHETELNTSSVRRVQFDLSSTSSRATQPTPSSTHSRLRQSSPRSVKSESPYSERGRSGRVPKHAGDRLHHARSSPVDLYAPTTSMRSVVSDTAGTGSRVIPPTARRAPDRLGQPSPTNITHFQPSSVQPSPRVVKMERQSPDRPRYHQLSPVASQSQLSSGRTAQLPGRPNVYHQIPEAAQREPPDGRTDRPIAYYNPSGRTKGLYTSPIGVPLFNRAQEMRGGNRRLEGIAFSTHPGSILRTGIKRVEEDEGDDNRLPLPDDVNPPFQTTAVSRAGDDHGCSGVKQKHWCMWVKSFVSFFLFARRVKKLCSDRQLAVPSLGDDMAFGEGRHYKCVTFESFVAYLKENGLPKSTQSVFKFLVGSEELPDSSKSTNGSSVQSATTTTSSSTPTSNGTATRRAHNLRYLQRLPLVRTASKVAAGVAEWMKGTPRHACCPHGHGCLHYVLRGLCKMFGIGFVVQLLIKLLSSMSALRRRPREVVASLWNTSTLGLGAFLGLYSGVYRAVNCALRWWREKDDAIHGMVAGLLAGGTMYFYKSVTVAMFSCAKLVEVMYFKGIEAGKLPHIPCADIFIYAFSTAFVFHAAVMEPHSVRPAYWKWLLRVTDNKFAYMNRRLLDVFGVNSSRLYPDYWPDYDPRFTTMINPPSS